MKWNIIDLKLIGAWEILVRGEVKSIEDVPEKYREEVEIKVAERIIEKLGGK